ncbi:hypothetical protein C454_19199 [Haloferax gibbonsii ATCC 33959]|uniref:Archaeal Type IV pilin N-terminal domain-containing protein n=1 Tax=Haloferax gibbonsii (strain ATCC 33959 / DSM 4427 / JCM 8863 / NBRC 102184 / NCIMB 2188 / Ma 2.38) TaxID=1227459 RepID=M0GY67_HALGM|nr:type IV pilin N-terminal domain-containing protein [Haloferax gibbonsii]ELZ75814.1 hypothetical protein C454_19199 [Haloferax gibbonsii ATCC 33959]
MQIKRIFTESRAVSPVIGVILMVAITVILAAVIGTFVLGLGDQVGDTAPQASFAFDYDNDGGTVNEAQVTITHESGSAIDAARLKVTVDGTEVDTADSGDAFEFRPAATDGFSGTVSAGTSVTIEKTADNSDWAGEVIRVVWTSESGSNSATLQKSTAPN